MFAPMRGVMAMQQVHCDMDDEAMNVSAIVPVEDGSSAMHASHDMSSMLMHDSSQQQSVNNQHQCCDGMKTCAGDCDMGTVVSLLVQTSNYAPLFISVADAGNDSSEPIVRELIPPSRPPAKIS